MGDGIQIPIKTIYGAYSPEKYKLMEELYEAQDLTRKLDLAKIAKKRAALPTLQDYYKTKLNETNPTSFPFLNAEQRKRLRKNLIHTYFLFFAQYKLDEAEERNYALEGHCEILWLCTLRIQELDNGGPFKKETSVDATLQAEKEKGFAADLQANIDLANKALSYVGLTQIARWFVEKYKEFMDNNTGTMVKWMSEVNGKRLYWVWGGGMLAAIFENLPEDFWNQLEAQANLATPSPVTGYMSWVLYYTRFGIHLLLLMKHTFSPSNKEVAIPTWERFKTQWNQRKFALLNDSIWGFANMLCFFWLKGTGSLGVAGNAVTLGLLLMDVGLTAWRFWEESTKHEANIAAIKKDRKKLEDEIAEIKIILLSIYDNRDKLEKEEKIAELEAQLKELDKLEAKTNFDWKYRKLSLTNELVYAVGLMLAFSIVCCFFFPPAAIGPVALLILGVGGAALCFVLTVVAAVVSGYLEYTKSKELSKLELANCRELLKQLDGDLDENAKRLLYLELKRGVAESKYQEELARFQMIKVIRSTLIDALIPVVVFVSLLFMPIGIGLAVMAAGLALAIISHVIISRLEPKPKPLPEFNEDAFKAFLENPTMEHLEKTTSPEVKSIGLLEWLRSKTTSGYTKVKEEAETPNGRMESESVPILSGT